MNYTAKKMAYRYLTSFDYLHFRRQPRIDKRTKVGRLALQMIYELQKTLDFATIKEKQMQRRKLKGSRKFTNVFDNPLVKDYTSNKWNLIKVHSDRLEFSGRNHWAKNEQDLRILKILKNGK